MRFTLSNRVNENVASVATLAEIGKNGLRVTILQFGISEKMIRGLEKRGLPGKGRVRTYTGPP
jgi:hypothetical protein